MGKPSQAQRDSKTQRPSVVPPRIAKKALAAELYEELRRDAKKDPKEYVRRWVVPGGGE